MMNNQIEIDPSVFLEQAEYIQPDDFGRWTVAHPQEETIIKKLTSPGAKLITGPRGCGKTTILLKALHTAAEKNTLAAYVNYKTSLKLEPFYKQNANAQFWFVQWMLLKIYDGLYDGLHILPNAKVKTLSISREDIKKNIRAIENGLIDKIHEESIKSLDDLQHEIESLLRANSLSRCILLLDDAAHAFSQEQQEDFFEFFRKIKSRSISPKAAIYPGVTSFSPSFHIGHDAEEISVWINPTDSNYVTFMEGLLRNRFPEEVFSKLSENPTLLKLIIYAANGMPRYMLNMINTLTYGEDDESNGELNNLKLERVSTLKAIDKCFTSTLNIYRSLKKKLPIYHDFIERGDNFFETLISTIKNFNKGGEADRQTTIIGIKNPIESEVAKVLGFLEYAGLVSPSGDSKRGAKGVYELYAIHNASIVSRNVFYSSRSINPHNYVQAFETKSNQIYPRVTTETIFNTKEVSALFELSLPPCSKCQTPRINEDAKYCIKCGSELTLVSVFEQIVNQDIDVLPLTKRRIQSIKKHSKIRKIKDILMDLDRRQLRSVPMIGEIWAKRIANYAEEQIA